MNKFTWSDLGRIIIALAAFITIAMSGAGMIALLGATAIFLVWLLNFLFERWKITLHKNWLTAILGVISLIMVYFYQPGLFPAFPQLTSETWLPLISGYIGALIVAAAPIISAATLVYNILLEQVLAKLNYQLAMRFGGPTMT